MAAVLLPAVLGWGPLRFSSRQLAGWTCHLFGAKVHSLMTDKCFKFLPEPEDGEELAPADQMFYDDMAWWDYERRRRMTPEELEQEEKK